MKELQRRPTAEEIDLVARFNYDRSGPIPSPNLLAKFHDDADFLALGKRVWQLLTDPDDE